MARPQAGDTVSIHYTGRLENGEVFDSSEGQEPLAFTMGAGEVIPGFENAVLSLEKGQKSTATIPPSEGYGFHRDDLVVVIPRASLPADAHPQIGQHVELTLQDGMRLPVVISAVSAESVTFDANHPLAGKTLIFDIELVGIE